MTHIWVGQARQLLISSAAKLPVRRSVGVLGDLGLDKYVFGAVERVSPEAPVLVLHAEREELRLGCAANVVRNLAVLGRGLDQELGVYGISGDDDSADQLNQQLESLDHLGDAVILRDASRPTIVKTRFIAGSHHQLLRCDVESSAPISRTLQNDLRGKLQASPRDYAVLVIEDYGKGLIEPEFMKEIYRHCREQKIMTMVDPNRNTNPESYRGADLITPNVLEAEILVGRSLGKGASDSEAEQAARDIQTRFGIKNVLLKRSAFGMTLLQDSGLQDSGEIRHFSANAKEVFDVTGAGDTVIAVLAAAKAWGADLSTAAFLANVGAGIVVGKAGAATVDRQELLAQLSSE